ncbi:MAG: PEP-CTERM sorting domain-containing protein [Colwellia sp.]|nr:PEP-CTERM sorting domain-containing protein [Colwellia sp.]
MNKKFLKASLVGLVLSISGFTNATLIDFEDNAIASGTWTTQGDIVSSGFIFDSSTNHTHLANNSGTFSAFNDSTWYGIDNDSGTNMLSMSTQDESLFSLNSFDIAEFFGIPSGVVVNVIGNYFGGGSVSLQVTLDQIADGSGALNDFQTVSFDNSWANLSSVTFSATAGNDDRWFALDNIVVNAESVPEPSTLAIFALGMIGLASRRFNKQS